MTLSENDTCKIFDNKMLLSENYPAKRIIVINFSDNKIPLSENETYK